MSARRAATEASVAAATLCAFTMIANQVAGKAVRDALFLSSFDITALPRIVVGSAIITIGGVFGATRILARWGPARVVPIAFGASAAVTAVLWVVVERAPQLAAVLLYLKIALFGAILISWSWSLVTERFDPRTARRRIARIASGGTLGGLLGGIMAERVGASFSIDTMLLVLAGLHVVSALATLRLASGAPRRAGSVAHDQEVLGLQTISRIPYLRNLAALVLLGTMSAAFLDYVFKEWAVDSFAESAALLRFFAIFYTVVAAVTFLVQATLTRPSLERLGLSRTASFLPLLVGVGGVAALAVPGLALVSTVRGAESAVRSSLFRSSYELFYAPIPAREKRATKTMVDVGFDRLGDVAGGLVIQIVLLVTSAMSIVLPIGAALLGTAGFVLTKRLHRGYVEALESNLIRRAEDVDLSAEEDDALRTSFLHTVAQIDLSGSAPDLSATSTAIAAHDRETRQMKAITGDRQRPAAEPPAAPAPSPGVLDPLLATAQELRSGDAGRVRRALRTVSPLPRELVPLVVPLLAWGEVTTQATQSLRAVADGNTGLLVDSLLDGDEDFSIRRRIPRVLAAASNPRAASGLVGGLGDRRFEVRYQCGVALSKLHERHEGIEIDRDAILDAVSAEARVGRRVWESHRLLDDDDDPDADESPFFEEMLRARSSRSLEHVFTLLSLVYPRRPLEVAYRGLYATDPELKGTALEYLEAILPEGIRDSLWPFLEDRRPAEAGGRPREEVLDELLASQQSIQVNLAQFRDPEGEDPGGSRGTS